MVVRQLDRLSRRTETLVRIRRQFEEQKVVLVADGKAYDFASYTGRMLFGVQAVMAEYESDLNGERVRAAVSVRKKNEGYDNVGRPTALSARKKPGVYWAIERGESKSSQAARYGVARSTVAKAYEEVRAKKEGATP
ncbi:site-specific recombinase, resolvase family [Gulosibacter sp. 10]|nr:site-specific recombinase, resolvase family [Gulosibacter sp. 10]